MVRLKKSRHVEWSGVEFQPNLLAPKRPVKLGAVLLETSPTSLGIVVIGRMPNIESPPPEFVGVSELMMKIAAKWVDSVFKDTQEAGHEGKFDYLADRWRGNLYIVKPKLMRRADIQGNLEVIAKRLYQKLVGEPFDEKSIKPSGEPKLRIPGLDAPVVIPPAWQLDEFKRQTLGQLGV